VTDSETATTAPATATPIDENFSRMMASLCLAVSRCGKIQLHD
jgi:hypothetical protein